MSCLRLSSCSVCARRCDGTLRSGGGMAASSFWVCSSSWVCCSLMDSIWRRSFSSSCASPVFITRAGGSGEVARPASSSPPPASDACAIALACSSGVSVDLALTRITSSGVSWNTRLKRSGSTKRTASSAACTASETPRAICRVLGDFTKFTKAGGFWASRGDAWRRWWTGFRRFALVSACRRRRGFGLGLRLADIDRNRNRPGRQFILAVVAVVGGMRRRWRPGPRCRAAR